MTGDDAAEWAFEQKVGNAAAKLVLLVLARHGWECCLSQIEIAEAAELSLASVGRSLKTLEGNGFVLREVRRNEKGYRTTDAYRLQPSDSESLHVRLPSRQIANQADSQPGNLTTSSDLPTRQPAYYADCESNKDSPTESLFPNPSPTGKGGVGGNQTSSPPKSPKAGEHPRFAEWYAAYPLRKERAAAVKAFTKAVAKARPDDLIAAAKRYHDDPQVRRGYIKNPATWLNKGCWLDEPAPGVAATGTDGRPEHGPLARVNEKWAPGQEIRL